jgi:hypothetical protein
MWQKLMSTLYPFEGQFGLLLAAACTVAAILGCICLLRRQRGSDRRLARYVAPVQSPPLFPDPVIPDDLKAEQTAPRRRAAPVAVLITDPYDLINPVPGLVIERSTDGVCLELDEDPKVREGSILGVRPISAPESIPRVEVQVSRYRTVGRRWELDCRFRRIAPWSVRMYFG